MRAFVLLCLISVVSAPLKAEESFPAPALGTEKKTTKTPVDTPDVPYIASLDTYGSDRISEPVVRKVLGKELDEWLKKGVTGDPSAVALQKTITKKLNDKFKFEFIQWSIMQYLQPGDLAIRVTLDVVEPQDKKRRMPFLPDPKETPVDPAGLIKKWQDYQATALELGNKGELDSVEIKCPGALHCLFGHMHPKLKPFGEYFTREVNRNLAPLTAVLQKHKDGDSRGAAAFLLAYHKDGAKVVDLLVDRIHDPDSLVRNNALRVLGDIAEFHPNFKIPVQPVAEALDFPLVTDRSKALFVLYALAESDERAQKVATDHASALLSLLRSEQPNQSGVAYAILRRISGKNFAPTEYDKWKGWYNRLPAQQKKN
ncbi:MAG: HEAT repeat domain-containing protein [Bdellovibrionota bacterium]